MIRLFVFFIFIGALPGLQFISFAQVPRPSKEWDRTFGGDADDKLAKLRATPDGGCLLAGTSYSIASGDKSVATSSTPKFWIIKLDAQGAKQWDRTYGGAGTEFLYNVRLTSDGGYLVVGSSTSSQTGDKTEPSWKPGGTDFWVLKLDATGAKQWDRTFGGLDEEAISDAWPTQDGGYLLGGSSLSERGGDKSQPSRGKSDMWLIKIDADGNKQWDRTLGSKENDYLSSLQQTTDGGYIVGGYSQGGISGDKSQATKGLMDYWVLKLDAQGRKQWDWDYGAPLDDELTSVQQTPDGGYLLAGGAQAGRGGDKSQVGTGVVDYWVIKTDSTGTIQWERTIGGPQKDFPIEVLLTSDGGYLLGGETYAGRGGDKSQLSKGEWDYWLVKLNAQGIKEWDQVYGGQWFYYASGLQQATDGGYWLSGYSSSPAWGDKSEPSRGGLDYWIIKLGVPHIRGETQVCLGGQVQLAAPAGAKSYRWSTGSTVATTLVTQPGLYSVTYEEADGLLTTLQQQVTAFLPPPVVITGDSAVCPGTQQQLTARANGATRYEWSTGATTPTITITQPGNYSVTASFGPGCTQNARVRIRAAAPVAPFTLGADTTLCEGEELVLRAPVAHTPGTTYRWSDGSTASSLRVQAPGMYSLQVMACGSQVATKRITVRSCLLIGNIITPNGDRVNDHFELVNSPPGDWALTLCNRWGREVFNTATYHNDWGEDAAAGLYYYLLHQPATGKTLKGWVEVVR